MNKVYESIKTDLKEAMEFAEGRVSQAVYKLNPVDVKHQT